MHDAIKYLAWNFTKICLATSDFLFGWLYFCTGSPAANFVRLNFMVILVHISKALAYASSCDVQTA